jgi:thioredoxin 1
MKSIINYAVILVLCCANLSWAKQDVPNDIRTQLQRGITGIEAAKTPDDFDAALKEFEGVVNLAPNWPDGHYYFGRVLPMVKGKSKQAINELNRYLELAPNAPDAETVKIEIQKLEKMRSLKRQSGSVGINVVKLSDGIYVRYVNPSTTIIKISLMRPVPVPIEKGDKIVSINGKSTVDMTLQEFLLQMDRGPGKNVAVSIVRGSTPISGAFTLRESLSGQGKMAEIEEGDFEDDVLNSKIPVVSVFWTESSPDCSDCYPMARLMVKMADECGNRIKFVNINIDENPDIAKKLNIIAIPTVIFYKKGQAVSTIKGLQQAEIQEQIKKLLE